ncbi:MAG TPA: ATP-binding protein, partial [Allocoleopsis sp.]
GLVVVDHQGKSIFFNPASEKLLNINFRNNSLNDYTETNHFYLPDFTTTYNVEELPWVKAIQGEEINAAEICLLPTENNSEICLSVNAQPFRDENHIVQGSVVVFRDVTQRNKIELSLRQSNLELENKAQELEQTLRELKSTQTQLIQSEKMSSLGQLVAGLAHEINNPVNFIYGNISHLQGYMEDLLSLADICQVNSSNLDKKILDKLTEIELPFIKEDLPKLLNSMGLGVNRIKNVILSLRNFSRLDEAELKLVDLHEGIDNTLVILNNRLKDKANFPLIQIIKEYGKLPKIQCYASQLNQVFMNVLNNAIDALYEKTANLPELVELEPNQITIITNQVDENLVRIRIIDNGMGMSENTKRQIFDPFFTTKPVGKGTGLGMSISYQIIVKNHQGKIDCISQLGQGTEFIIEIPMIVNR